MDKTWVKDDGLGGARISPCGNFSAKKINGTNKDQMWELKNYVTGKVTYHKTFGECKRIAEEFSSK